jgi:hypothetical protein
MPARLTSPSRPRHGVALAGVAAFAGAMAITLSATAGGGEPSRAEPVGSLAVPLGSAPGASDLAPASAERRVLRRVAPLPPLAIPEPVAAPVARAPRPRPSVRRDPDPPPVPRAAAAPAPPPAPLPPPEPVYTPAPPPAPAPDPGPAPDPAPPAPAPDAPPVFFDDSG